MDYEKFDKISSTYMLALMQQPINEKSEEQLEDAIEKVKHKEASEKDIKDVKSALADMLMEDLLDDDDFREYVISEK